MFPVQLITNSDQVTITSTDFRTMVNTFRLAFGENEIRNNDFMGRIKDELEGDRYETFVTVQPGGGKQMEVITLTLDQAMLVGMRESKAVRRSVLAKLKELAANVPTSQPKLTTHQLLALVSEELNSVKDVIGTLPDVFRGLAGKIQF